MSHELIGREDEIANASAAATERPESTADVPPSDVERDTAVQGTEPGPVPSRRTGTETADGSAKSVEHSGGNRRGSGV